jgi:hypothetical protein
MRELVIWLGAIATLLFLGVYALNSPVSPLAIAIGATSLTMAFIVSICGIIRATQILD